MLYSIFKFDIFLTIFAQRLNCMLTAILIDDMPEALDVLRSDLATYCPDIQVIGEANSVVSAAKLLRQQTPDLLFLDILMGDGTGFDLLEIFPNLSLRVIFVTASEDRKSVV